MGKSTNSILFYEAYLFEGDGVFRPGSLRVRDGVILEKGNLSPLQGERVVRCLGQKLLPGFVDIHTHGRQGGDFSSGDPDSYRKMARSYAEAGVTSLLATTMTLPVPQLEKTYRALGRFLSQPYAGSRILGINMEGPFLSEEKRGAHDRRYLKKGDAFLFHRLNALCGGRIRLCSVAPEIPGGLDLIRELQAHCVIAVAHTGADYTQAAAAFQAGAKDVTHLYNAMPPYHHRQPGAVGAAFDADAHVELICDGIHLHPQVIRSAFRQWGSRRVCLISDSMSAAGLADGDYSLGGQAVSVKDRKATLADGTIAGSVTDVAQAVRFCCSQGIPQYQAIFSATATPACLIGMEGLVGSLSPGCRGDLLLVENDLRVKRVFLGGEEFTG